MTRIRAVIFDYGEVLSAPANRAAHSEMVAITGLPEETFEAQYWAWRLDYDADRLNGQTYWEKVATEADANFTPSQIQDLIARDCRMWMDLNRPMLRWADELRKANLATGILSNMGRDTLAAMRRDFAWLDHFSPQIWSCELGVVKPELAIYREVLRQLDLDPAAVLFIDNIQENTAGAAAAGMRTVLFKNVEQLARELARQKMDLPAPRAGI